MGANAQTAVPAFTAGQVLTAAQQTQINTGIPVFATTTTRDAAFGGTGEKTLAEGQFAYIEASNTTQYYDGAAWQTLGGGLNFLTGGTFSAVTSFSLPNDTFTTSYQNYKMILNMTALTADADFTMRLRAAGSDNTNNSYERMNVLGTGGGVVSGDGGTGTSWKFYENDSVTCRYGFTIDIIAPKATATTFIQGSLMYINKPESTFYGVHMTQSFNATTSFDSLTFISSVASSMSGNYYVYGYANS